MTENGLIIVDKPAGMTSHDVVDAIRQIVGQRRVGHAGTLDPFATGVLPVCFGSWTRLTSHLAAHAKRYTAQVRFGFATDTDDATGSAVGAVRSDGAPDLEALRALAREFVGEIDQLVPAYSAKRVAGRRLHTSARAGESPERPVARVHVHALEVVSLTGAEAVLDVRCSAGTYIRALARDLGARLGLGGHLSALRRTEAGGFLETAAQPLAELQSGTEARLVPADAVLTDWPAVVLNGPQLRDVRSGRSFAITGAHRGARARLFSGDGALAALADVYPDGSVRPRVVLVKSAG